MTSTWPPTDLAVPLLMLGEVLGISAASWAAREQPDRLSLSDEDLPVSATLGLRVEHLQALVAAFGSALICRFRLGDLSLLEVSAKVSEDELAAFRGEIQGSPTVAFDLVVNKQQLVEDHVDQSRAGRVLLYLFPAALERAMMGSLVDLERFLWPDHTVYRTVVLIPNRDIRLHGPYLTVLGGTAIGTWQQVLSTVPPNVDRVRWIYQACRQTLKWQDDWLRCLTPLHLMLEESTCESDAIHNALLIHQANVAILYTADRTTVRGDRWQSIYADPQQSIDVTLWRPVQQLGQDARRGAQALGRLADWVYDPAWYTNRLALMQVTAIRALWLTEPEQRYAALLQSAPNLVGDLRWHWKSFVANKLDAYSAEVQDLEDAVAEVTQGFADQTGKVVDRLSETMLTAISAVLGSFIAALFTNKFNTTIFRIGMGTYAFYVLVFPLGLSTWHEWQRVRDLEHAFVARRRRFEERLPVDRVTDIVGQQVASSRRTARRWFVWTMAIYTVVVILAAATAFFGPDWVTATPKQSSALDSTPSTSLTTSLPSHGTPASGAPSGP